MLLIQYYNVTISDCIMNKKSSPLKILSSDSEIPELHGLKGGEKRMWLKIHRDEVLQYLDEHGEEATRRRYALARDYLLSELQQRDSYHPGPDDGIRIKPVDRNEFEYLHSQVIELRHEVSELKRLFSMFSDNVSLSLAKKFIAPMLSAAIDVGPGMDLIKDKDSDPLNVQNNMLKINSGGTKNGSRH